MYIYIYINEYSVMCFIYYLTNTETRSLSLEFGDFQQRYYSKAVDTIRKAQTRFEVVSHSY